MQGSEEGTPKLLKQQSSLTEDWGDGDDWDVYGEENENQEEQKNPDAMNIDSVNVPAGKGYESLAMDKVRVKCLKKMEDLTDLFAMDEDLLIIIARHYNWNEE